MCEPPTQVHSSATQLALYSAGHDWKTRKTDETPPSAARPSPFWRLPRAQTTVGTHTQPHSVTVTSRPTRTQNSAPPLRSASELTCHNPPTQVTHLPLTESPTGPPLLAHTFSPSPSFSHLQAHYPRAPHSGPTLPPHRTHTELTQNPHRPHTDTELAPSGALTDDHPQV